MVNRRDILLGLGGLTASAALGVAIQAQPVYNDMADIDRFLNGDFVIPSILQPRFL